jgi:hypothetical protein
MGSGVEGEKVAMAFGEKHYTVKEFAEKLRISASTAIRWVKDDPDVLRQHNPGTQRKREYNTYSIPEHVALRIYSAHLRKNARKLLPGADRRKVAFPVVCERRKANQWREPRRKFNLRRRPL